MSPDPSGEPNPAATVGELARRVLCALGPSILAGPLEIGDDGAISVGNRTYNLTSTGITITERDEHDVERTGVLDETSHRINWRNREPVATEPRTTIRDELGTSLRVPFGQERGEPLNPTCSACGARRGAVHARGCEVETCPRCRDRLVACGCFSAPHAPQLPANERAHPRPSSTPPTAHGAAPRAGNPERPAVTPPARRRDVTAGPGPNPRPATTRT